MGVFTTKGFVNDEFCPEAILCMSHGCYHYFILLTTTKAALNNVSSKIKKQDESVILCLHASSLCQFLTCVTVTEVL